MHAFTHIKNCSGALIHSAAVEELCLYNYHDADILKSCVCIFFAGNNKDCGDTWMRSGQQAKAWEWRRPICWLHGAHATQESARHHRGKISGTNPLSHPCNDVCWSWDNSKHYLVCCQVHLWESRGLGCAPGTQRKRKADLLLLLLFTHHQLASL